MESDTDRKGDVCMEKGTSYIAWKKGHRRLAITVNLQYLLLTFRNEMKRSEADMNGIA